jgi:hypothetical protein
MNESRRICPEEWTVHWPHISESLDRIPQYWSDYWTKDFINESVVIERWQAWGFGVKENDINVVVLTHICQYPANRFLQIPLAFGNQLEACLPMIEATMERFAVAAECDICEIVGRPGWERKLPRFRRYAVVLKARVPKMGVH